MKIAIFTQNLCAGGVQKSVITLANHLKNKHEVTIILAQSDKTDFYSFASIKRIKSVHLDTNEHGAGEWLVGYRTKALLQILLDLQPDLLISNEDYNNIISLQTKFKCKKIVISHVNLDKNYSSKVHLLPKKFYIQNIRNLYPKATFCTCVSKFIQDELKDQGIEAKLIYNGVNLAKPSNSQKNFIISLGRLHPQKGHKDLLQAYAKIHKSIDEKLIIIGDGALRGELESLAVSLGLQGKVEFTGFVDPTRLIQECKMAVMPSYYEGFSIAALEILAQKKAILAYHYNGADEIFDPNDLVKIGDIATLATRLKELLLNQAKLNDLEMRQYQKLKDFDIKTTMHKYDDLINKALQCAV